MAASTDTVRVFQQTDTRYTPVESTLPAVLPPLSRAEADRAHKRLCKHFGRKELGSVHQLRDVKPYKVRVCWISKKSTSNTNHFKGWGRLIHDASHEIFRARHPGGHVYDDDAGKIVQVPGFRPHDGGHAALELEIAQYVVTKGWLDGVLKPPTPAKPSGDERRAQRLVQLESRASKWESKLRRATNALRKLKRQRAALLRSINKGAS